MKERLQKEQLPTEEVQRRIGICHLGFPILGGLHFLQENPLLFSKLQNGEVRADPKGGVRFGREKIQAGVLGLLLAGGALEKYDDGNDVIESERYYIPNTSPITIENILASGDALRAVKKIGNDLSSFDQADLDSVPPALRSGLAIPVLEALHKQVDPISTDPDSVVGNVQTLLESEEHSALHNLFAELGLIGSNGVLNEAGEDLLTHRVTGSFARLAASYIPLISNLDAAAKNPDRRRFGNDLGRDQRINAVASNALIQNVINKLGPEVRAIGPTSLDLGSGGGHFSLGIGAKNKIFFDMSAEANAIAIDKARAEGITEDNFQAFTGDITNVDDLRRVMRESKFGPPDSVTINYIVHDIMGQAASPDDGHATVVNFLKNYKEVYGSVPLIVTESWDVSWDDLKAGGKPYITLYAFLHAISPQHLISRDELMEMAEEAGFEVTNEITNGKLFPHGVKKEINQTLFLQAVPNPAP